eukprot:scaffold1234_cov248-Pinguiococcus_pyrenoidosus.AAC.20
MAASVQALKERPRRTASPKLASDTDALKDARLVTARRDACKDCESWVSRCTAKRDSGTQRQTLSPWSTTSQSGAAEGAPGVAEGVSAERGLPVEANPAVSSRKVQRAHQATGFWPRPRGVGWRRLERPRGRHEKARESRRGSDTPKLN